MGTSYGPGSIPIFSSLVDSINITGGTVLSTVDDPSNGYTVTFRHDLAGCGSPDSGIFIVILDFMIWRYMSCRFRLLGTASCWSFMNSSGYGSATGTTSGNMLNYDESLGDRIIRTYLAQDEPEFVTHNKVLACDNNADNFMRFNGNEYKIFTMVRRRNVNGSLAGVHHGRSCNSTGAGALTIVDQIRVW
jgi:hypothetical protein